MVTGNFYYLKDSYYNKFPNCNLIGNKDDDTDSKHDRPCFYCFEKDEIYWMIPISSQIEKKFSVNRFFDCKFFDLE